MPKYSFILPIYNVEKYLECCIESILNQKVTDFEVILVDDGSPDKCPDICDKYKKKDSRIKVIHKENGGLSDARNKGLEQAIGKYILFVDSDDYISNSYLETIDKCIGDNDLLIFSYKMVYKNHIVDGYAKNYNLDVKQAEVDMLDDFKYCGYVWNKVLKREIIEKYKIKFDLTVTMSEDILFSYQYIEKCKKIIMIDDQIIFYRQRKSSLISNKIRNINASSLVKTYIYIIKNTQYDEVALKCKSLYLKSFYKYKKYIKNNDFDMDLIDKIKQDDYCKISKRDKKLIFMYKYFPAFRSLIYYFKNLVYIKYE